MLNHIQHGVDMFTHGVDIHTYLHDVDRVEVRVAEGQLPAQELVALDQLLVLRNLEDLSSRFSQPPSQKSVVAPTQIMGQTNTMESVTQWCRESPKLRVQGVPTIVVVAVANHRVVHAKNCRGKGFRTYDKNCSTIQYGLGQVLCDLRHHTSNQRRRKQ